VTIAADFRFDLGILLCADTRWTGKAKTEATKIFTIKHHAATVVLALAGREAFAKRAVERIAENIRTLDQEKLTLSKLQDKIEAGLRDIYQHIYTHPDRKTPDSPEFAFVMGLYSPIDGHFLLMSDETITPIMPTHVCEQGAGKSQRASKVGHGRVRSILGVVCQFFQGKQRAVGAGL